MYICDKGKQFYPYKTLVCNYSLMPPIHAPLKIGHGWTLTSHIKQRMHFFIHFIISSQTYHVDERGPGHFPAWGCFIKISRALKNNFAKINNAKNHILWCEFQAEIFYTKFQLEILKRNTISAICNTQISIEYFEALVKRLWNTAWFTSNMFLYHYLFT